MKRNKYAIVVAAILIIAAVIISIFRLRSPEAYSSTNYFLGTVNTVTVYSNSKSEAEKILAGCDDTIQDVDNMMSTKIPGSDIYKINKNAGISPVEVSDETMYVIEEAIRYSKLSDGVFDVSIGPVSDLWAIGTPDARVPSESEISEKVSLVDYSKIEINKENNTVMLPEKGMKLDLGAIAKGYAADKVSEYLDTQNVENAIINLGGNIYAKGYNEDNKEYNIGLKNPIEGNSDSFAEVRVSNKSVVTSGVYERYVEKDGKKYHHILNPFTGYPFENNLLSVTIISDKSINCDALSTSAFGLGLEKGKKLIESIDGVDAVFVTKDKKVYTTKGFEEYFEILDDSFTLETSN